MESWSNFPDTGHSLTRPPSAPLISVGVIAQRTTLLFAQQLRSVGPVLMVDQGEVVIHLGLTDHHAGDD
jgi:hypothetical protein